MYDNGDNGKYENKNANVKTKCLYKTFFGKHYLQE